MAMLLSEIIKNAGDCDVRNFTGDVCISTISNDTRKITDECMFIAVSGNNFDSHRNISEVVAKGAVAVVIEKPVDVSKIKAPVLKVPSSFEFTKKISAAFYNNPASKMLLAGITGTNGKTTTSYFMRSVLAQKYGDCGLIGTIKYIIGNETIDAPNTSPEPLMFQEILSKMVNYGLGAAVMEVSSHAIKLGRVENTEYDYFVFTNLSKEHTEFHPTMEDYFKTKASIFKKMFTSSSNVKRAKKYAIINRDDVYGRALIESVSNYPGAGIFKYSATAAPDSDLYASDINVTPRGVSFNMNYRRRRIPIELKLTGVFNVYNALAAAACGICAGLTMDEIKSGLEYVSNVPGRFQRVNSPLDFSVFIDFAHTPESFSNVLALARSLNPARIITVFGCGGDRSREKRPMMGYNAVSGSDVTIITSDNPRSEDPLDIIKDIQPGAINAGGKYIIEPDRAAAIEKAISLAKPGDIVMILGKGHENYQIIGREKIRFDDYEYASHYLNKKQNGTPIYNGQAG